MPLPINDCLGAGNSRRENYENVHLFNKKDGQRLRFIDRGLYHEILGAPLRIQYLCRLIA